MPTISTEPPAAEQVVCGVDEVGRGPLAGPVVAAAVILSPATPIAGLADSKTLLPARRLVLARQIRQRAEVALGLATVEEIDRLNILQATLLAMARAVARLPRAPALALVDGNRAPQLACRVECVVGGDASEPAISAASIVAKCFRDRLMSRLARRHPGYGWEHNAGYATEEHRAALTRLGPTVWHRRSFGPVKLLLSD
jgi:ribonuclease HII